MRALWNWLGIGLLGICGVASFAIETTAAERNIVLFVADDLGKDLGCYGNTVIRSPHIDSFARRATVFTNAFATTASCSASRSVILTGLHNHANAQYGHQHHYHHFSSYAWIRSLPQFLSDAGYRTARVGKYHVAPESVYAFDEALPGNSRDVVTMVENARAFMTQSADQPFFLYMCTSDPHRGGGKAAELPQQPDRFGNKAKGTYPGIEPTTYAPRDVLVPPFLPDTPACRAELAQYYQSVSRIDQGFGYLLQTLAESGLIDSTLVMLISDHGIAMPGAKTTVYEPGLGSPCLVRIPGRPAARNDGLVSWVDIVPTLLDYAGVLDPETQTVPGARLPDNIHRPGGREVPYHFHGRSFLPLVGTSDSKGFDRVFASHTFHEIQMYYPMRVVRERKYKLIWNIAYPLPYPFASDLWAAPTWQAQYRQGLDAAYGNRTVGEYIHRPEFELYDVQADPYEGHNLADDPEHAQVLAALQAKLKAFQKATDDPWVMKWDYE